LVPHLPHHQRLKNTVGPNTGTQGSQFVLVERFAGLIRVILDETHGNFAGGSIFVFSHAKQGIQSTAKSSLFHKFILVSGRKVPQFDTNVPRGTFTGNFPWLPNWVVFLPALDPITVLSGFFPDWLAMVSPNFNLHTAPMDRSVVKFQTL